MELFPTDYQCDHYQKIIVTLFVVKNYFFSNFQTLTRFVVASHILYGYTMH